jgi:NhaA family Na+:H+ antiporter
VGFSATQPYSLGIIIGLVIGKPLGIVLFSLIVVGLGISILPPDLKWKNIIGIGILGGIGFTMSIFITLLAFDNQTIVNHSKIAILLASLIAGIVGFIWLKLTLKTVISNDDLP